MARWVTMAILLVSLATREASAARVLLAEFLARAPAEANQPAMSTLALEACVRRAQELDRTGAAIDFEIAAIDREAAEALFLQKQINMELPMVGNYGEPALNEFRHRVIRHEELAKKFQAEFPLYQKKQKAYEAAVDEFEHIICTNRYGRGDLEALKNKLDLK